MKITNNVYLLSGTSFSAVRKKNVVGEVYGIYTRKGIILIDCGKGSEALNTIHKTLKFFNVKGKITHCILTHAHNDHCGNAKYLQSQGVKIIVGSEDYNYCKNGGCTGFNSKYEKEQSFESFIPDQQIKEDETIKINHLSFKLVKTPGHTPGSMAIIVSIDGKTIIFTGDMLQPNGLSLNHPNFGWTGDPLFNRDDFKKSIKKLSKYDADIILPGHGTICLDNASSVLKFAAQKVDDFNEDNL